MTPQKHRIPQRHRGSFIENFSVFLWVSVASVVWLR